MLTLFTYFRSSASYRIRIALGLKELRHGVIPIHLLRGGGEQHSAEFVALNPSRLVPVLMDGPHTLTQSMAILEYLEEQFPKVPLLPEDAFGRARVRSLSQLIACDIHPLNNLRVLKRLEAQFGADADAKASWYRHWIAEGFEALETALSLDQGTASFCHGERPSFADCCLVPQVFNAERFNVDLSPFPTIRRIAEHCATWPAFVKAAPENQADAE